MDTVFLDIWKHSNTYKMDSVHIHNYNELFYLKSGKIKYFIGSEIYILHPGDFIFVPAGEFHKTDSEESDDVERMLLCFEDDFLGEEYLMLTEELKKEKQIKIPRKCLNKFYDIYNKIEYEEKKQSKHFEDMEKMYLRQILILIDRYKQKVTPKELSDTYTIIQNAARYISSHHQEELSLEIMSRKFAISPYYFSKLFKEVTGVGFSEYINISRITMAQQLLSQTNITVTKAAQQCGFNDSNYFAHVFKKLSGMSPKKYSMQFTK